MRLFVNMIRVCLRFYFFQDRPVIYYYNMLYYYNEFTEVNRVRVYIIRHDLRFRDTE